MHLNMYGTVFTKQVTASKPIVCMTMVRLYNQGNTKVYFVHF